MSAPDEITSLFRQGRLAEALDAATVAVRNKPTQAPPRIVLAELLLFTGALERADKQLAAASGFDAARAAEIAGFRRLLQAERARQQLLTHGRVPEFLESGPTVSQQAALAGLVALRANDLPAAAAHLAAADAARPPCPVVANGAVTEDWRDGDDLFGGTLEVLTQAGRYLWVPFEMVRRLELPPPQSPRDLFWREATLEVTGAPSGPVFLPALYPAATASDSDALRLGRATVWRELADGIMLGSGQRLFLTGVDDIALHDLVTLVSAT